MDSVVQFVQNIIFKIGFIPSLLIVFFLGMYFFWRESLQTRKNRNSIFDVYLLVSFLMLVWGRIMYVLSSVAEYKNLIWFISPYERYSDGVYFFRLLPWRYFRIWDGGALYIPMFVAFLIVGFLVVTLVKKWRWREVLGSIYLTSSVMFGLTLTFSGLFGGSTQLYKQGLVLLGISFVYLLVQFVLKGAFSRVRDLLDRYLFILSYLYSLVISLYVINFFEPASVIDMNHISALTIFTVVSTIVFFVDMQRKTIDIESVNIQKAPATNQPIKMKERKKK